MTPLTSPREVSALNDRADQLLPISPQQTLALAEQAYTVARQQGYRQEEARALMLRGYGYFFEGKYILSEDVFQQSYSLALELEDLPLAGRCLNGLAISSMRLGQVGLALERHLECLRLLESCGDDGGRSRTLNNIGNLYVELRDHEEALRYHLEALELARHVGRPNLISGPALNVGHDYHELGRFHEALGVNLETLEFVRAVGFSQQESLVLANLALNHLALTDTENALKAAQEALALTDEFNDRENYCHLLGTLGRIRFASGDVAGSIPLLQRSLSIAQEMNLKKVQAEMHSFLADVYEQLGDLQQVVKHLREQVSVDHLLLNEALQKRTQLLATQLKVQHLEQQADAERRRNVQLEQAHADLKAAHDQLHHQATHDSLTGLLNRRAFEQVLDDALGHHQPEELLAVLLIDLDHFKHVNDTLGHPVGDDLLRQVAARLNTHLRSGEVVARLGGDEFVCLLRSEDMVEVDHRALAIHHSLDQPFSLAGHNLHLTASIGCVLAPMNGRDHVTLLKNADLAMYHAKNDRNNIRHFHPVMSEVAQELLIRQQELRTALERSEFTLHYQPILDTATLKPVAVEALIRWNHPRLGLQSAGMFMPDIENSDLAISVGRWVIREALQQLAWWRRQWPELRLNVNVAPRQFAVETFAAELAAALNHSGVPPQGVTLEMTEGTTLVAGHWVHFDALLQEGLNIAIDDFGSGYSNMRRLADIPARIMKIDASLIRDIRQDHPSEQAQQIVRALISFASSYNLHVVAEGVETEYQLAFLRQWQCDSVQGYLLARPMPAEQFTQYMEKQGV